MTDTNIKLRKHYSAAGLTDRIKAALATVTPESGALTVAQLAPLDQFHIRGILATTREHETTRFNLARYRQREFEKLKERKSLMKKYSYLICVPERNDCARPVDSCAESAAEFRRCRNRSRTDCPMERALPDRTRPYSAASLLG